MQTPHRLDWRVCIPVVALAASVACASEYDEPLRLYTGPPGAIGAPRVEPRGEGVWNALAGGTGPGFAFDTFWVSPARSYAMPGREYWGTIGSAPLSAETRNLFAAFRSGADFGTEVGVIDSCVEQQIFQARIWLLEGTYADVNSLPDRLRRAYLDPANRSIVDEITAMGLIWRPESEYVRLLNLSDNYGEYAFSGDRYAQLIMVPVPGVTMLTVLGIGTLILLRRRF